MKEVKQHKRRKLFSLFLSPMPFHQILVRYCSKRRRFASFMLKIVGTHPMNFDIEHRHGCRAGGRGWQQI